MIEISDHDFESIVNHAVEQTPEPYKSRLENIAFLIEDEPTPYQRQQMSLRPGETLFGLYEGLPLPRRGGSMKLLPDKITVFKLPLLYASGNLEQLRRNVGHTIWHEVAHYFGLDHKMIDRLDEKGRNKKA
jgi:predicted Zn-dependent protease with MMP-like domain